MISAFFPTNMRTNTLLVSLFTILANGLSGEDKISDEALAFWKKEAKPLLEQNCWKCHGAKERIKGDLRLTTRDGVIKGGEIGPSVNLEKPEASLLLEMVSYKDEDHEMPPIGKLKEEEIALRRLMPGPRSWMKKELILTVREWGGYIRNPQSLSTVSLAAKCRLFST